MDQRTNYVENLSAQMSKWDVQIDRLKNQAEAASAEANFAYAKIVALFQWKRNQAAEKLRGIAAAGDDEWEAMKDEAEQIWAEVKWLLNDVAKKIG
jgi:hypothetical protein